MITIATGKHRQYLLANDRHISAEMLKRKIAQECVLIILQEDAPVGWLRWGYFWDEIPFMNMLHIAEAHRQRGLGRRLVSNWHGRMRKAGYDIVMTSTLADEPAQHFYRKLGYVDSGALFLPKEAAELILIRRFTG